MEEGSGVGFSGRRVWVRAWGWREKGDGYVIFSWTEGKNSVACVFADWESWNQGKMHVGGYKVRLSRSWIQKCQTFVESATWPTHPSHDGLFGRVSLLFRFTHLEVYDHASYVHVLKHQEIQLRYRPKSTAQ